MLTDYQKEEVLSKILKSKFFLKSPTSQVLLKFLVQSTIDNVDIKESVIGMHIYGDRYEGEKSNAKIRVSVYHLRKKLEQYYKNDGVNDGIRLTIEKGQYQVTFISNKNKNKASYRSKLGIHIVYTTVILLLLTIYFVSNKKPNIPIWNSMLSNSKETVIYIGDVYGYLGETPTGGSGWQRDFKVNSEEEFILKKEELNLSDKEVKSADYTYVTASEVDAIKSLSRLFFEQKRDFPIRLASKINEKDLKEQNNIYAGPIKTNNRFIQLLTEQFDQFKYENTELFMSESNNGEFKSLSSRYYKELLSGNPSEIAIVAKFKGTYDTQQFLFFSDHDMGVRATVDFFTSLDSLRRFQEAYLKDKEDFIAIFLVKGKDRVDLGMKLLDVY